MTFSIDFFWKVSSMCCLMILLVLYIFEAWHRRPFFLNFYIMYIILLYICDVFNAFIFIYIYHNTSAIVTCFIKGNFIGLD